MNTAKLEDNKLYITSQYYSSYKGRYMDTTVIPVENIECIRAKVGKQGGMHIWSVNGYDPEYSELDYNKKSKRDIELYGGDRKDSELIDQIRKLIPGIKYRKKVESGGAPW